MTNERNGQRTNEEEKRKCKNETNENGNGKWGNGNWKNGNWGNENMKTWTWTNGKRQTENHEHIKQ